jgi:hypothetical protein
MVAFSRSGESCLLGKCTAELPKVRVPEETLEILQRKAREAGFGSLVEYQRMKALIDAHGLDTIQRLQQNRLNLIAGIVEE